MWWYKKSKEPIEKWVYYPWYKALKYATYKDWRYDFPDAINDIADGFVQFWKGVFALLLRTVQWVFSPILKPIAFIRFLPKFRKDAEKERDRLLKEWQDKKNSCPA